MGCGDDSTRTAPVTDDGDRQAGSLNHESRRQQSSLRFDHVPERPFRPFPETSPAHYAMGMGRVTPAWQTDTLRESARPDAGAPFGRPAVGVDSISVTLPRPPTGAMIQPVRSRCKNRRRRWAAGIACESREGYGPASSQSLLGHGQ